MGKTQGVQKSTVAVREKLWEIVPDSLDHIREVVRYGRVRIRTPRAEDVERDSGHNYSWVDLQKQGETVTRMSEMVLKSVLPMDTPDALMGELAHMSFEQMGEVILHDGVTPHIRTLDELKHYLLLGADYSLFDPNDPSVKKKLGELNSIVLS